MARDQYQTVKEVADLLQVSEATVRSWIKDGGLRAIDIGKGWRIADSDLALFLSSHATRPRAAISQERGSSKDDETNHGDSA
tara:strand:+ start:200 stop:445 length:246 start_codon:yes stop_codon:yes gene_type:complete